MRIPIADLDAQVAAVLAKIKAGVETARAAGLICELPEKVDFQVEVVTGALRIEGDVATDEASTENARTSTRTEAAATQTNTEQAATTTTTEGGATRTTSEGAATQTTTEIGSTDTTTVTAGAATNTSITAQATGESGGDTTDETMNYT